MTSQEYRKRAEYLLNRHRVTPTEVAQAAAWARLAQAAAITEAAERAAQKPAAEHSMADFEAVDQAEYAQFMTETDPR